MSLRAVNPRSRGLAPGSAGAVLKGQEGDGVPGTGRHREDTCRYRSTEIGGGQLSSEETARKVYPKLSDSRRSH